MNIYEIRKGNYKALINVSKGANCISLRNSKYNSVILREPDYSQELDNSFLYGMPILFPVNRISRARFWFEGREYLFPVNEPETGCSLHGSLLQQEFQIVTGGEDYVICSYKATKEKPYMMFPHEFEVIISYYLTDKGLEQKTEIKNLSEKNMPIMIGFHTTFMIPFAEGQESQDIRVGAEVKDWVERNEKNHLPTGTIGQIDSITEQLLQGEFVPCAKKISRHYKCENTGKMHIDDAKKRIRILYENSANFKYRMIFNGDADKFICLEPQNCVVDCMNTKFDREYSGFEYVEPFQTKTYFSKISIMEY